MWSFCFLGWLSISSNKISVIGYRFLLIKWKIRSLINQVSVLSSSSKCRRAWPSLHSFLTCFLHSTSNKVKYSPEGNIFHRTYQVSKLTNDFLKLLGRLTKHPFSSLLAHSYYYQFKNNPGCLFKRIASQWNLSLGYCHFPPNT